MIRQWLTLVEAMLDEPDMATVYQVIRNMSDDDIDDDELQQCIEEAQRLAAQPELEIFRVMFMDAITIRKLKPGMALGYHWSSQRDFDTSNLHDTPRANVLIAGKIAGGNIVVAETAAVQYVFPDEHEIIFRTVPTDLVLIGIYDLATHRVLRADLAGKIFHITKSKWLDLGSTL